LLQGFQKIDGAVDVYPGEGGIILGFDSTGQMKN